MTQPVPETAPSVTRNPVAMILGLIGVAAIITGAFLNLLSVTESPGIEAPFSIFWALEDTPQPSFFASAGFAVIVIGVITLIGVALSRMWITVLGGLLAMIAAVAVIYNFMSVEIIDVQLGDMGIGLWTILGGGILAIVAGILSRRATV